MIVSLYDTMEFIANNKLLYIYSFGIIEKISYVVILSTNIIILRQGNLKVIFLKFTERTWIFSAIVRFSQLNGL